jgi:hypothetical protein
MKEIALDLSLWILERPKLLKTIATGNKTRVFLYDVETKY